MVKESFLNECCVQKDLDSVFKSLSRIFKRRIDNMEDFRDTLQLIDLISFSSTSPSAFGSRYCETRALVYTAESYNDIYSRLTNHDFPIKYKSFVYLVKNGILKMDVIEKI